MISIHFRGITITPGGFAEAAFVRRSRALAADLPTPFNSLTMPGASQSSLSEFFGSARQSRPTIYVDGRLKNVEFSSYVSGDFLSAADTSSATQTNSYSSAFGRRGAKRSLTTAGASSAARCGAC